MNKWLFNPFIYVAGSQALIFGWVIMLATTGVAYLSYSHFDGALDMHLGAAARWSVYAWEQLIAWGSLVLFFYPVGLFLSESRIRFIDVAGTIALARALMLFASFAGFLPGLQNVSPTNISASFLVVALLILACAIWMIALLYNAFALCCNLKGSKATLGFIGALVLAELFSKLVLTYTSPFFHTL